MIAGARIRRWTANLILLGAVSLATFLALEIVFRYTAHRILGGGEWIATDAIFLLGDDPVGYSLRPNASRLMSTGQAYTVRDRVNSLGMNDVERTVAKVAGMRRILVLGDSFVFGQGVRKDRSLTSLLDSWLPEVEVLNAGVPGYGLEQEYVYFKERGRRFEPDLVLVGFFMNDLHGVGTMTDERDEAGLPVAFRTKPEVLERARRREPQGLKQHLTAWLRRHSLLFTFARSRLHTMQAVRAGSVRVPGQHEIAVEGVPDKYCIFERALDAELEARWDLAYRTFDSLKASVEASGGRLAIFSIPAPFQVSDEEFEGWAAHRDLDISQLSRNQPFRMVMDWCERSATPCLDLLETFEGVERDDFYFRYDLHWTPEGHRRAAETLRSFLRELGFS